MHQEQTTIHHYELRARTAKVLIQRLYRELSTLVVEEIDLAKAETAQAGGVARVARTFALSVVLGTLAFACLTTCAIFILASYIGAWEATLILGIVLGLAAFALNASTKRAVARITQPIFSKLGRFLAPADTNRTLAERQSRVEWTRRQVAQTMAALEQKTDVVTPLRQTVLGLGSLGIAVSAIIHNGE